MDNPNTGTANADKPDTGISDPKETNGAEANRVHIKRVEEPGTGITNPAEADGAEADGAKADGTDEPDIE